ncbi:MAG TPA: response regulator transcription factor, partial [Thermoleophilaceae bacterium]|nr:response regulator transcription factor [Thermoleophilaceae bacterium]
IAAGARGYVLKSSPVSDLIRSIRSIAGGQAYVDPALSPTLLMDPGAPEAPLPERERQILQHLAEGLRTEEVAARVGLSAETVKADTKRAIHRLEATGRVHAVANALRRSYIT